MIAISDTDLAHVRAMVADQRAIPAVIVHSILVRLDQAEQADGPSRAIDEQPATRREDAEAL